MYITVKRRLIRLTISFLAVALGITLILVSMRDNIVFYYTPSEIPIHQPQSVFRVGGLVVANSIHKDSGSKISFIITDGIRDLQIEYSGIIPALFREGQGAIVTGNMQADVFIATELLAKHDENYKPPKIE